MKALILYMSPVIKGEAIRKAMGRIFRRATVAWFTERELCVPVATGLTGEFWSTVQHVAIVAVERHFLSKTIVQAIHHSICHLWWGGTSDRHTDGSGSTPTSIGKTNTTPGSLK